MVPNGGNRAFHRVTAALTQEQLPGGKLLFRVRADQAGKVAQWLKRLVVKSNLMTRVWFPGTTFPKRETIPIACPPASKQTPWQVCPTPITNRYTGKRAQVSRLSEDAGNLTELNSNGERGTDVFLTIWSLKYFSSFLCKVNHLVFQVWGGKKKMKFWVQNVISKLDSLFSF